MGRAILRTSVGSPLAALKEGSQSRFYIVALVVAAGVALALRMYRIQDESLWYDETVSYQYLGAPTLGEFLDLERRLDPPMTPGYFVLQYGWARWVSRSVYSLRILSISAWMLALLVCYRFARRAFGRAASLLTVCSLALSMPHILYAQEVRMYSLTALLAVFSTYALYEMLDGGSSRWRVANIIANSILVWTHLLAVLVVIAQGFFLFIYGWRRRRLLGPWVLAHAPALLGLACWVTGFDLKVGTRGTAGFRLWMRGINADSLQEAASWIEEASWRDLVRVVYWFPTPAVRDSTAASGFWVFILAACMCCALLVGLGGQLAYRASCRRADQAERATHGQRLQAYILLMLWFLVPSLGLLVLSWVCRPCFVYRYVFHSTLAMHILIGGALASIRTRAWCTVVALVLFGLYVYHLPLLVRPMRADFRRAAGLISAARPSEGVFVTPGPEALTLRCYSDRLEDCQIQPAKDEDALLARAFEAARKGQGVWLVLNASPVDRHAELEAGLNKQRLGFTKSRLEGLQRVYIYRIRPPRASRMSDDSGREG